MAFGNNRASKQPRATFMQAGGSTISFRHPFIAGQYDTDGVILDEIDISRCCKLEGRFFEANQNQDNAKQVVLVDGSVVTITNRLLNGTITMPVIRTTGLVSSGDFIATLHMIRATGDNVGGLLIKTDRINGKAITRVYYGVTVQRVPDDISEGNDVPVYNVQLLYAGWIEAVSTSGAENKKKIWAVGNKTGLEAYFSPYSIQNGSTAETPINAINDGIPASEVIDEVDTANADMSAELGALQKNDSVYADVIGGVEEYSTEAVKEAENTTATNPEPENP